MKRFGWVITLTITVPVTLVAVVFAINNSDWVAIDLWPLPIQFPSPIFLLCFFGILIGFLAGASAAWMSGHKWRSRAKNEARTTATLRKNLAEKEERLSAATATRESLAAPSQEQPTARFGG